MFPVMNEDAIDVITEFIRQKVEESGGNGVVIGLSGGLDSATVAKLCADAVGVNKVLVIYMPSSTSPKEDEDGTRSFAEMVGMEYKVVDIQPMVDAFLTALDAGDPKLKGNIMARCRMIILYHYANMMGRVVMGAGNKSEILMGYFTKFGDGGADFLPIGDIYKTQVRELARRIGVPEGFIVRPPSAGLWEGQTDEEEMGISYEHLDAILDGLEVQLKDEEIVERGSLPIEKVRMVRARHMANVHKRKMPLIPKVGLRTVGLDWRE